MRHLMVIFMLWAQAFALHIDVTQGRRQAIPVALSSWSGTSYASVQDVVKSDLYHSGEFDFSTQPEYEIRGSISKQNGTYQASIKVLNLLPNMHHASYDFSVRASTIRRLAHRISDGVYHHLTGVEGVFSSKIAYLRVDRSKDRVWHYLEVADMDGHHPRDLVTSTQPLLSPAWSPDGQSLAYVSFEHHHAHIYVQNIRTGARRLVAKFSGINSAPNWSPDGKSLVVVSTQTGYPHLYRLNLESGRATQLTFGRSIDTEPAWSHDGQSILFTSDRAGSPQIYQLFLSSGHVERKTFGRHYATRPRWVGPSDQSFVMLSRDQGHYAIIRHAMVSGEEKVLVASGTEESPSVAFNGRMVAYAKREKGRSILAMVSIDGEVKLALPSGRGEVYEPIWSPKKYAPL